MKPIAGWRSRTVRLSALVLAVVLVGGACTPPAPTDPGSSTTVKEKEFCSFWEDVTTPPTQEGDTALVDNAVLVKSDVVAQANSATVTGDSCKEPTAQVDLNGAMMAEGMNVPSVQNDTSSDPIATVTGDEIAPGTPVLETVELTSLSAAIGLDGITLRGNVALRISGQTSTVGFVGTLTNLENWSINISSSSFSIPGITSTPARFNGTLRARGGEITLNFSAAATSAKIGDVTVSAATIDLFASNQTGVKASVAGNIKVGPSTVNGAVDVEFDRAGALVSAKADIAAHLVGTQVNGKKIDLNGSVKFEGNAKETTASFSGSGVVGDLVVHEANGSLTLATNKATFNGVLDVEQGANLLRFNGSIVWDGTSAYTPYLQVQGAGEFSGTLNDGQTFSAAGTIEAEVIGGQMRSVVTGNFKIGTLKASGSAVVETNGASTTFEIQADLVDAGFAAHLTGAVIVTDGVAETVQLDASVSGAIKMGDVTLTNANLSIRSSYGSPLEISFDGSIKMGSKADLSGSVKAAIGPNGTLLSLNGQVNGSLALDSWAIVNFQGSIAATSERVTINGSGGVNFTSFPAGLQLNGTLTSSLTNPSWSLSGSADFRIGSLNIASARMTLSQAEGMKATRVGFYFNILFISTYFEGNFYMNPAGGCDKVDITGGGIIAKLILVTVLPGAIGCPVHI
ncbi:MAG: hypothetical protein WBA45_08525 [Microthrixaceae bacterium]